ncbi:MAG: helix-turn-helix domain-containing protein, partial [Acidimicrobiia bacterium]
AGRAGRAKVEARTDALAEEPWRALGPERTERLLELLTPMARAINDAGGVPVPNPVGVPAP